MLKVRYIQICGNINVSTIERHFRKKERGKCKYFTIPALTLYTHTARAWSQAMAIKQNGSHNFVTLASSGFLLQHAPVELVIFFYLLNSCHKRRWLWGLPTFPCGHGLICFPRVLLAPPNVKKCSLVQLSSVRLDISWQLLLLQLLQVLLMSEFREY